MLVFVVNPKSGSASQTSASQSAAAQSASGPKLPHYAPAGAKNSDKIKVKAVAKFTGTAEIDYGVASSYDKEESSSGEFVKEVEITRKNGYKLYLTADSKSEGAELSCSISVDGVEVSRYSAKGASSSVKCDIPLEHKIPEIYSTKSMQSDSAYEEEEVTIEARVTNNGTAQITYGPDEARNKMNYKGDWSTTVKQERRASYEVSVSTSYGGDATEVTCTILVNGQEVSERSATNKYSTSVTCAIPYTSRHRR